MAWYADLSPCDYMWPSDDFLAVGWLTREQPFSSREVSNEFFEKLCDLLVDPWNPVYPVGGHRCAFCRFTGGTAIGSFGHYRVSGYSCSCLFVPGNQVIYVSPASIAHYIDAHHYQPPSEFREAVIACPPMRSLAYFKALLANGAREMIQHSKTQ